MAVDAITRIAEEEHRRRHERPENPNEPRPRPLLTDADAKMMQQTLRQMLKQRPSTYDCRPVAIRGLSFIGGDEAIDDLIAALNGKDRSLIRASAESLARLRASKAIPHLVGAIKRDPILSSHYIRYIGDIGGKEAVAALEKISASSQSELDREYALEALDIIAERQGRAKPNQCQSGVLLRRAPNVWAGNDRAR
jgi:HEAT repeat protein